MIGRVVASAARAGIRAGGQPAPSGPPRQFSPGGKAVAWFFIIAGCATWWRPILLYAVLPLAIVAPFMIATAMGKRHRPAQGRNAGSIDRLRQSWEDKP